MKFTFKIQQYQTDAVNAVVNVFRGQSRPNAEEYSYLFEDIKNIKTDLQEQQNLYEQLEESQNQVLGYANAPVSLSNDDLLKNIRSIQAGNNIK